MLFKYLYIKQKKKPTAFMKGFAAGKNPGLIALGQVNFALGQVKIEVWWPSGQGKVALVVL